MSKIFEKYKSLKEEDPQKIYLFRSGIFYISLNDDAKTLNQKLNLSITDFGTSAIKCGFPANSLKKYLNLLEKEKMSYLIIENNQIVKNKTDYLNNLTCKEILDDIKKIDMNQISYKNAFEKLLEYTQKMKKIED